jgi:hypothetical protein
MAAAQLAGEDFLVGLDRQRADTAGQRLAPVPGVVKSYIDAHERNDLDGLMSLLREDLRFAMLPEPGTVIMTAKDAVDGLGLRWALPARLRRLALYHHDGQPHACRRAVPPHPRRPGVPAVEHRSPAHRRRSPASMAIDQRGGSGHAAGQVLGRAAPSASSMASWPTAPPSNCAGCATRARPTTGASRSTAPATRTTKNRSSPRSTRRHLRGRPGHRLRPLPGRPHHLDLTRQNLRAGSYIMLSCASWSESTLCG